jgi:electron transport complex protein RnfB
VEHTQPIGIIALYAIADLTGAGPSHRLCSKQAMYSRATILKQRVRSERLKKPPLRIRHEDCVVCDACQRACPPHFGAVINIGLDVHIVPELCTSCGYCLDACPIACIEEVDDWTPSSEDVWSLFDLRNDPYVGSRDVRGAGSC